MPVSLQGTSASVPMDPSGGSMDTNDNVRNREFIHAANVIRQSQKLEGELRACGLKIKHHEDRLSLLKADKVKLEDSIIHLQVAIGKSKSSSTTKIYNAKACTRTITEEEVLKQILRHEKSAAGVFCQMKTRHAAHASLFTLTEDVLGIVAMLGRVEDDNLSRLFSEYFGVETMLAKLSKCITWMVA